MSKKPIMTEIVKPTHPCIANDLAIASRQFGALDVEFSKLHWQLIFGYDCPNVPPTSNVKQYCRELVESIERIEQRLRWIAEDEKKC